MARRAAPKGLERKIKATGPLPVSKSELTKNVQLDPETEIERQKRIEGVRAALLEAIAAGRGAAAIDQVMQAMLEMERENERLAWRLLRASRYRFGSRSEKLSPDELKELSKALGGDATDTTSDGQLAVPTPPAPEQVDDGSAQSPPDAKQPAPEAKEPKKKRKRVRSMKVSPDVERHETVVPVPEEERLCALCGRQKDVFDYVEHQRFRYVPAKIVVDVERREKVACGHCRKDVSVAPRSDAPDVVRKVDASLLARIVKEKAAMGVPLDRQRHDLDRMGLDVPYNTLLSYWAYTCDLLEPVAAAIISSVFGMPVVGVDDTRLSTLSKDGCFKGHLWCFVGTDGVPAGPETVAYGYTPSWRADEIADWFSGISGMIQCDGYAGYATELEDDDGRLLVPVPSERRLGCAMHIRSKFHDALLAKDKRAAKAIELFGKLYNIEAECKAQNLDAQARGQMRLARSLPILDEFYAWVDDLHPRLLPKSPLSIATTYATNQREFFRRCFSDGRFEIDNGRVERRIRLFATARRGFLFTGSVQGGERLATVFTIVDNCLLLGIDPQAYLDDVIRKLEARWPLSALSDLLPARWAAQHPAKNQPQ